MNRRMIILAIAGVAVALFAGGAFLYSNNAAPTPATTTEALAPSAVEGPVAPPTQTAAPGSEAVTETTSAAETPAVSAPRWNEYVRRHSPVIGPANARVTIVEFFDPSCEACRAFYPIVHEIMRRHPNDVRLVLRYTPLHEGSEEASRILETARMQNVFEPVLTAMFREQPQWASHGSPQMSLAWDAAQSAGLNVSEGRAAMNARHISAALTQDMADARTLGVRGTPTFYVNEKPLENFGPQQLYDLVLSELQATQ